MVWKTSQTKGRYHQKMIKDLQLTLVARSHGAIYIFCNVAMAFLTIFLRFKAVGSHGVTAIYIETYRNRTS